MIHIPENRHRLVGLKQAVQSDLLGNILPFWFRMKSGDAFLGGLRNDLTVVPDNPISLVMVSRILWTYSRAFQQFRYPHFKDFADEVFRYMTQRFHDRENGGYVWWLTSAGVKLDTKKQAYGQAYVLYALTEYFMATTESHSLVLARNLFSLMEKHFWRGDCGGYWEALDSGWGTLEDVRLSGKDMNAPLSMNTHLHIMEAYANLLRADPDPDVVRACGKVLDVVTSRILHPDGDRFGLFYDAAWNLLSDVVSPGHDIEGSWLIWEMASLLKNSDLLRRVRPVVLAMVDRVIRDGLNPDGSVAVEYETGQPLSAATDWWPQAEGVIGFLNAYEMTSDVKYLAACENTWAYISSQIIDHVHGEWFAGRKVNGEPLDIEKAGPWKACYHNGRMGFEVIQRMESILNK